jgi:tetratricopeptide (TPR) repeat protein
MLEEILKLQRNGDNDPAEQRCRELLTTDPNNAQALRVLSALCFARGAVDEALRFAQAAVSADPQNAAHLAYLGGLEFSSQRLDTAEAHLREALSLDPNIGSAHLFLGHMALQRADNSAAQEHFKSAERVDAENPQTLASLGSLALQRNDPDLASRYYLRAAELAPNEASIQAGLGRTFHARGVYAFAVRAFENALRLQPDMHSARHWLGQLHLEQGEPTLAEAHFQMLDDVEGYEALALVGFGDAARLGTRLSEAAGHYRAALIRDPNKPRTVISLAWCLLKLGQVNAAMDTYNALLAFQPDEPRVLAARAELFGLVGQRQDALHAWQDILARNPDDDIALARLPLLLEMLGRQPEAVSLAERCLARNPQDVDAHFVLARAMLHERDAASALQHFDAIDRASLPEAGRRQLDQHRGFALDQLNRTAEAAASWLAGQSGLPANGTPWLKPLSEDFAAQLTSVTSAQPLANAPVLVLGAPGSGVVQLTTLLTTELNQLVLRDRFQPPARADLFTQGEFDRYPALSDIDVEAIRQQYFSARAELDLAEDRLIDWLPRWDARFLPAIQRALPGTRIIIVERDLRQTLLNWLACGAAPGFALPDVDAAAEWLKLSQQHFAVCRNVSDVSVLYLDGDALKADPTAALQLLVQFLDRPSARIETAYVASIPPGLPEALPASRWFAYRDALAPTFARFDSNEPSV